MQHRVQSLLLLLAVSMAVAQGSVTTLFATHVPLLDPQKGLVVRKVVFSSRYSQPEATVGAVAWPYRVNAGPGEPQGANINLASLCDVRLELDKLVGPEPAVTLDISAMKPLPKPIEKAFQECSKAKLVQAVVECTERNLEMCGIHNCRLNVRGLDQHPELSDLVLPKLLAAGSKKTGDSR